MKRLKLLGSLVAGLVIAQSAAWAVEVGSYGSIDVQNRLRIEYDDNIYETADDKTDSFKIIEEIELSVTFDFQPTFITLRYRPSFTWWENREPDDTDLHHDLDVILNHTFSPRVSLGVKNVFRLAERPEQIDRGTVIREDDDFIYNVTDANLDVRVLPRTHAVVGGRYTILRYDRDEISATDDYDIWAAGLTLRHHVTPNSQVTLDLRHEDVEYDSVSRGSESQYAGVGLEQMIGSSFVGMIRGGYQWKEFEDSSIDDDSRPYGDFTLTYILSPKTRFAAGAGFSMFEADVFPFANQERTIIFASAAHDVTAKFSVFLSGSYQMSDYDGDETIGTDFVIPEDLEGEEEVVQGGVRLAYKVNTQNTIELNYQYLDLTSDIREEFDRNRVSIGWRLDI